jgi:hypothetical protein
MPKQIDTKDIRKILARFEFRKLIYLIREKIKKELVSNGVNESRIDEIKTIRIKTRYIWPDHSFLDSVEFRDETEAPFYLYMLFGPCWQNHILEDFVYNALDEKVNTKEIYDDGNFHDFNITEEPKCPVFFVEND